MSKTCSDDIFWCDGSPDWDEYINQTWNKAGSHPMDAIREVIDNALPKWGFGVLGNGGIIQANSPKLTIFHDEIRPIQPDPGADTHDEYGRPVLDPSGGPRRQPRDCHHGLPVTQRCPRCYSKR